ncbi:MAG TPA: cupin domain-containing protein [Vicinamibacterales bacterium]|nr:cupin domain-containing protein [Vicinamibacterales bacterium]
MKKVIAGVVLAVTVFAAGVAVGQQAGPTRREPQFENSEVQVWKSIINPGKPLGLHRHDHGRALISLNGGTLHVVDADGKVLDTYNLKAGTAMWLDADKPGTQHADVNPGKEPVEVIVVQLKNDKPKM